MLTSDVQKVEGLVVGDRRTGVERYREINIESAEQSYQWTCSPETNVRVQHSPSPLVLVLVH